MITTKYQSGHVPTPEEFLHEIAQAGMTSTEAAHSLQVSDAVMKRWLDGTVRVPASAWEMYWTKMHFNRMTHDLTNIVDGDVDRADEILLSHPSAWMRDLMTAYFTIVYDEDMC